MHRVYCDNKKEEIKLQKELCEDEAAVIKLIASKF